MTRTAYVMLRSQPVYRHQSFVAGLKRCGFNVELKAPPQHRPEDVLVIWNRYGRFERAADAHEKAGGTVLVAENGYMGKDSEGRQFYALAKSQHNGAGQWHVGGPERWQALGFRFQPWRKSGKYILVREQRGIGSTLMRNPRDWHLDMAKQLKRYTDRPVRIVPHPAKAPNGTPPLNEQLKGAWAVVTWASAIAGHALLAGVPVWVCAPHHVLEGAVERDLNRIDDPSYADRKPSFERMAWAMWSVAELESGMPFDLLLGGENARVR